VIAGKYSGFRLAAYCWLSLLGFIISSPVLATGKELKVTAKYAVSDVWLRGEVDYRQHEGYLFKRHYDVGLRVPLAGFGKGWLFGLHYRLAYKKSAQQRWELEKRPYIQLQKTFNSVSSAWLPELKWWLRTRHEFRRHENKDNSQRNRIKFKARLKESIFHLRPFVSNEYYYDFNKHELTKVRFDLGVELPKTLAGKPSLYYKHTSTHKGNKWEPYSGLVLKLAFN